MAELVTQEDEDALADILLVVYSTAWLATRKATAKYLGKTLDDIKVPERAMKKYLDRAATRVVDITETTRKQIRELLKEGQSLGLSAEDIANGKGDYRGLRGLFDDSYANRHMAIAKTELANATLAAQREVWPASGIGWAKLTDGTQDPCCSPRNGQLVPSNEIPDLCHPYCQLRAEPYVRR